MDFSHLKKIVDNKQDERTRWQRFEDWLYGRQSEILTAPSMIKTDFWCDECKRDVEGVGYKQIRMPKGTIWFAYYAAFCPKGHKIIRRITDKIGDPYFTKSMKIKREQGLFHDDMLAPTHPRFRQLYPAQYSRLFLQEKGIIT